MVETVAVDFLDRYRTVLGRVEDLLQGIDDPAEKRPFALRLLNRLLFAAFLREGARLPEGDIRYGGTGDDRLKPRPPGARGPVLQEVEALAGAAALGNAEIPVPEEVDALAYRELLDRFSFTLGESPAAAGKPRVGPEALAAAFEALNTGRQERGAYCTPEWVVAFMVREALKAYLETGLSGESSESVGRLVDGHDHGGLRDPVAALDALRRARVCDPACGSGAFLLGMLDALAELRGALALAASPGVKLSRYQWKLEILRDSLYGVDLDPGAAEVARFRLALSLLADWEGPDPPPPPDLGAKVVAGDSLAGFDWATRFPEVFAGGGFDLLVMNPPYLAANRLPGDSLSSRRQYAERLRKEYGFADDLYVHFLHRALRLLKSRGALAALTSNSFLTNPTREPLRRELLSHTPRLIALLGPGVFPATVYPAVMVLQKGDAGRGNRDLLFLDLRRAEGVGQGALPCRPARHPYEAAGHRAPPYVHAGGLPVPVAEYERAFGAIFFEPTPENRRLFGTVLSASGEVEVEGRRFVPLGVVAPALDTGIHSGNVRRRLFCWEPPPGRQLHRLLQGTQVVRYGAWWGNPRARYRYVDLEYEADPSRRGVGRGGRPSGKGEYWHFCGPVENHHVAERLLMRQTEDEPFVGYLHQGSERIYTDNTVHTLLLTETGRRLGLTYRYLLALLNSGALARIYRAIAQEEGRTLAQVKTTLANRLPVLIPTPGEARELEALVAEIQRLHAAPGFPLPPAALDKAAALQAEIDRRVAMGYHPILRSVGARREETKQDGQDKQDRVLEVDGL